MIIIISTVIYLLLTFYRMDVDYSKKYIYYRDLIIDCLYVCIILMHQLFNSI